MLLLTRSAQYRDLTHAALKNVLMYSDTGISRKLFSCHVMKFLSDQIPIHLRKFTYESKEDVYYTFNARKYEKIFVKEPHCIVRNKLT